MTLKKVDLIQSHPLTAFVVENFKNRHHQDATTLSCDLAGRSPPPDATTRGVNLRRAYASIAEHILESLLNDGIIVQDKQGWYVLAKN